MKNKSTKKCDIQESKVLCKKGEDEYQVSINLFKEYINIKVLKIDSINIWQENFSFDKFTSQKAFALADNLEEVFVALNSLIQEKEFSMSETDKSLIISFVFKWMKKIFSFDLELKLLSHNNSNEILNELFQKHKLMKNEITLLKAENATIRDEISQFKKDYSLILEINSKNFKEIYTFEYPAKKVICYKFESGKTLEEVLIFQKFKLMDWYKPESSEEINQIINYFYQNRSLFEFNGLEWIVTYGINTDPSYSRVGSFVITTTNTNNTYNRNQSGEGSGDDGVSGRCNGNNFAAFRYYSPSFFNPKYNGNFYMKNSSYSHSNYAVACLQMKK
jgi:hypothetical protein